MMPAPVVDLIRVRSALARLDQLAARNSHLIAAGVTADEWLELFATEIDLKPQTYSTEELANMVGLHPETIRREIKRGKLKAALIGRVSRISALEAAAWWEAAGGGKLWEGEPPAPGVETSEPSE